MQCPLFEIVENKKTFNVGDRVTCDYRGTWRGTVIPINDVRIWSNTLAFNGIPTQEEVNKHIQSCIIMGLSFEDETPVEWEFGKFYWDSTENLHLINEEN